MPVAQSNWCNLGNDPQTVLWLYAAIIGPYISYAAVVWWPRVDPKTVNNQLEHIQRLAYLYTTGAMRTTPTAALEIIVGLSPLIVYTRQEAMMACYQLQLNTQWSRSHWLYEDKDWPHDKRFLFCYEKRQKLWSSHFNQRRLERMHGLTSMMRLSLPIRMSMLSISSWYICYTAVCKAL